MPAISLLSLHLYLVLKHFRNCLPRGLFLELSSPKGTLRKQRLVSPAFAPLVWAITTTLRRKVLLLRWTWRKIRSPFQTFTREPLIANWATMGHLMWYLLVHHTLVCHSRPFHSHKFSSTHICIMSSCPEAIQIKEFADVGARCPRTCGQKACGAELWKKSSSCSKNRVGLKYFLLLL